MKRYLFFAVVALFVLVFVAGCMRPEGQTPAVQNYGAVVVEKAGGGYVVEVTKDLGVVEVDFEGVISKDAFKTSSENLFLYKVMNGKTIVAVASTKGVLKEKEEVIKVSCDNVEISAVRTTPAINIVKASVESWEEYQNDPNARLLGDSHGKDGYRDSKVDIYDFVRFVKAYGEDGEYNPEFDFTDGSKLPLKAKDENGKLFFATVQATDNKVGPHDFYVFAYNYGMVVNRNPVIESVKVGGEDVTEKVKAGETIYKPAGSYEVKVEIKDYDGNEIVNENVSVKNFDLNSGNREVTVEIRAEDNFGGTLKESFTVKLQAVQILWKYEEGNESAANKNIVLLGDNDTANLKGTIYLGEKSWENVSKYNFTVFNGDVAIATSNELTEPASYIKAVVDNAGIKFEVYDEKNNKLDSFEATGLNWTTPGGSVITAKINIFTPDDLVHPNPDWSGQGEFKVYYFEKPTPGPLSFKLTDDTQNAKVVTTGKLWVNGAEHKYLKVYVKVPGVKDLTIDKFVFNFSVGGKVGVPISEVVVDPAEALKYVDIDGVKYYYFAADEATLTFDLSEIVDELGSLSDEISTMFEGYDVFSNDINGNDGSNGSNKIGSANFEIEGKNTLYFDNKAPRIKGLLNRYLTPNKKAWFKFVNETGEVFEDANEVSAKITLYLGNEDPANKTINNEAAFAGFKEVTGENEWDATITFADWPKLKSIDKTYFCVKATVSDEFGNKSYTNLYCYTTEGSRMYVDTYVNRADVGWDFTGKHIDEDTDPASTYTSWSATGTFDMRPERSGIEKYQFFVKTDKGNFVNATSVNQKPADGEDFHNGVLYTPKISFKDVPYTEGVLATVTFLVWDKEGNVTESKEPFVKEFIVDTKASTIATFDGNTLADDGANGAKISYTASIINSSLAVKYSTENVYKVYAKVFADIKIEETDYSETPYIPNETGVIRSNMLMSKKFDKALDLVDDLGLVVEHKPATIIFTLVDYAGNKSTAMISWNDLTTKLKTIFADWNKTKLELNAGTLSVENDPGFDILNYDPQPFGVVGPKLEKNKVDIENSKGRLSTTDGKLSFTFYATTTSKDADVYIKDYDSNYTQDGTNNTYDFNIVNDGKVKKVTITLKNNTDEDIDFEDEYNNAIIVELLSSENPGTDKLEKLATVTFNILPDLELDPEESDFAATIQIDKVTSEATLIIEIVNENKKKYLDEATFVQDKYLSIWDASDLTSPVEVYSLKDLDGTGFKFTLKLASETYSIYKDYYYVSISKEGARYMLKGTNGKHGKRFYETNDNVLEQIEANVEPVE